MSDSKAGPTTNTQGTSTLSLPGWYQNAWQGILGLGGDLYGGLNSTVAGLTPDQMAASDLTNSALETYMARTAIPAYDVFGMGSQWDKGPFQAAQATVPGVGGMTAQQATASQANAAQSQAAQLAPSEIAPFMNPYIDTALDPALNRLRQQQGEVQAGIDANAAAAGSFGGSRDAVQRSLADRNYRDTLANTAGNMLNQGWNTAAGLAGQNTGYKQQTALSNAQLENTINALNAQLGTQVSLGNAQMGNQMKQGMGIAGLNAQTQMALQNANAQNQANSQYQNLSFQGAQSDAARFLQAVQMQGGLDAQQLQSILGGTNALNQMGTQQQQTAQQALNSYWQQLMMLSQLLKLGNPGGTTTSSSTGTSTKPFDWGSALIGGIGLGSRFLSDREDKTDIKKLGKDPQTGVDMYSYRYKDDPKSYPKVVGPMAQDIEKIMPGITQLIGGHRVIQP